jgi:hypothetical protein
VTRRRVARVKLISYCFVVVVVDRVALKRQGREILYAPLASSKKGLFEVAQSVNLSRVRK